MFLVFIWTCSIKSTFNQIHHANKVSIQINTTNKLKQYEELAIQVQYQPSRNQERPSHKNDDAMKIDQCVHD